MSRKDQGVNFYYFIMYDMFVCETPRWYEESNLFLIVDVLFEN